MRGPSRPRLPPLSDAEASADQSRLLRPVLSRTPHQNVYRTIVRHPSLYERWSGFARYILFESTLEPRDRELVILRCGWRCRAEYEWAQHVPLAKQAGLTPLEIERIEDGAEADGWSRKEANLLRAVDSLHERYQLPDALWNALRLDLREEQMMDLVFTIGQYHLVAMALNAFGVEIDRGLEGFRL